MTAEWNPNDFQKREHSLVKPYTGKLIEKPTIIGVSHCLGTGFGVPNWDFLGSTMVTSNYIRLTSDDRSRQGAIWNKVSFINMNIHIGLYFRQKSLFPTFARLDFQP